MNDKEIEEMVMDLINSVNYDMWKFLNEETSEDPEVAAITRARLVSVAREHITKGTQK